MHMNERILIWAMMQFLGRKRRKADHGHLYIEYIRHRMFEAYRCASGKGAQQRNAKGPDAVQV